jgi:hypothetical protein
VSLKPSITFDSHVVRAGLVYETNVHLKESPR